MFYFATESGDHVIKILICDWSVFNVVVVFVRWSCKFCLYFWLLKFFNLFSLFNMSWTDSQIESLITFYSSVLVSGAGFWSVCHQHKIQLSSVTLALIWSSNCPRNSIQLKWLPLATSSAFIFVKLRKPATTYWHHTLARLCESVVRVTIKVNAEGQTLTPRHL